MGASLEYAAFLRAFAREAKPFLIVAAMNVSRGRAERIAARARELAPIGDDATDPHAGRLKEDIGLKGEGIDALGPYVDVGTTVPEGFLQEYGTVDQDPQPFMRPAVAEEML